MTSPMQSGPMKGLFYISTGSTAQGIILDNNLPVNISYVGYKTVSGEYDYDETDLDKYPIIATENKGDLIAQGRWDIRITPWTKFGYNPDSGIGSEEVVAYQGGSPNWTASSGMDLYVISTTDHDAAGGSGALSVWIKYLDATYSVNTTVVTMGGSSAVAIVDTSISRILNFQVYSGNAAKGNIYVYPTTGGILSQIGIGQTRARNTMYTVPDEKTLYIKNVFYSGAGLNSGKGVPTRFLLKSNYSIDQDRYSSTLFWPVHAAMVLDTPIYESFDIPIRIPEKSDIYVSATLTAASSANVAECVLRGFLVDNT